MFNSFRRKLPEISIFHHPSSPPSNKALALLRSALSSPYPSTQPSNPPLQFDLEVVENTPTADQLNTILSYLPSHSTAPSSAFLSAHFSAPAYSDRPETVAGIFRIGQENPSALKWPIVVDWSGGQASVGNVEGVKEILDKIRQKRDGESKEKVHQPKGWFT